jgi:hypothetical protein
MLGSMATVPLPGASADQPDAATIGEALFRTFGIEVPIIEMPATPLEAAVDGAPHPPDRFVRISAQHYNDIDQYARLADALIEILGAGRPAGRR